MTILLVTSGYAYERPREAVEWTTTYVYNAPEKGLPRILLVGDSICRGYEKFVRNDLAGAAFLSSYATSKCVTDRSFLRELSFILGEYDYDVVHFNNGVHCLNTPPEEWEKSLRAAFDLVRKEKPGARIIWCSSTPLKDAESTAIVRVLNEIGEKVAKEYGLPVTDLFSLMDPLDRNEHWTDKYHFKTDAKSQQGQQVVASIRATLGLAVAASGDAARALAAASSETGPDGRIVHPVPAAQAPGTKRISTANEIIMDYGDPGYSETGLRWTDSALPGFDGSKSRFTGGNAPCEAWYVPKELNPGKYEVFVYKVHHLLKADPCVTVEIRACGQVTSRTIDFSSGPSQWVSLGVFTFGGDQAGDGVVLRKTSSETILRADAVKWVVQ